MITALQRLANQPEPFTVDAGLPTVTLSLPQTSGAAICAFWGNVVGACYGEGMSETPVCACGSCFDCRFQTATLADVDRDFLALIEAKAKTGDLGDEGQRWLADFVRNMSENVRLGFLCFESRDDANATKLADWCTARAREADEAPRVWVDPGPGLMKQLLSEGPGKQPGRFLEISFGDSNA